MKNNHDLTKRKIKRDQDEINRLISRNKDIQRYSKLYQVDEEAYFDKIEEAKKEIKENEERIKILNEPLKDIGEGFPVFNITVIYGYQQKLLAEMLNHKYIENRQETLYNIDFDLLIELLGNEEIKPLVAKIKVDWHKKLYQLAFIFNAIVEFVCQDIGLYDDELINKIKLDIEVYHYRIDTLSKLLKNVTDYDFKPFTEDQTEVFKMEIYEIYNSFEILSFDGLSSIMYSIYNKYR